MEWFFLIPILVILAATIANGIVIIDTFYRGVVRRFEKMTGRILKPGINFIIPFIEDVLLKTEGGAPTSVELRRDPITVSSISRDNMGVEIDLAVQWRADENLMNKYVLLGEKALKGLDDAVESEIGTIIAKKEGREIKEYRQALQDLINCVLRLKTPPHEDPKKTIGVKENPPTPENRLEFYTRHIALIQALIKKEATKTDERSQKKAKKTNERSQKKATETDERSQVESRYGIDIITIDILNVRFGKETMEALEQKQRVIAEMEAAEKQYEKMLEIYNQLRWEQHIPHQEAMNQAANSVGLAAKQVYSVEGLKNLFGSDGGDK